MKNNRIILLISVLFLSACSGRTGDISRIAVFVPEERAGTVFISEMGVGVSKAAKRKHASVETFSGGPEVLDVLVSAGDYSLIVTSGPETGLVCRGSAAEYPEQNFLILDGRRSDSDPFPSVVYRYEELAYAMGYFAGLVTLSDMPGADPSAVAGLIVDKNTPEVRERIRPGFLAGLRAVDPSAELLFAASDNSASASAELFDAGADIVLSFCGSGDSAVIETARDKGKYVLLFSSLPGPDTATVLAWGAFEGKVSAEKKVLEFLNGSPEFTFTEEPGFTEGAVRFYFNKKIVSESIGKKQNSLLKKLKNGNCFVVKPVNRYD